MNKSELRQSYVDLGYEVEPVATWDKVSEVGSTSKYDVNVVSPNGEFYTAQVIVTDDGQAGEAAEASGRWKSTPARFSEELAAYLRSIENDTVLAIAVTQEYSLDSVALVEAFIKATPTTVSKKTYVVYKRNNTFSYSEVVA